MEGLYQNGDVINKRNDERGGDRLTLSYVADEGKHFLQEVLNYLSAMRNAKTYFIRGSYRKS